MDIQAEFNRAVAAARQKDFQAARTILRDLLKEDPHHANAWILFAHVAQTREHAIYCFERALFLEHDNTYVRQQLNRLRAAEESTSQQTSPPERTEASDSGSIQTREPVSQPVANVSLLKSEPDKPKRKISALEIILLVILALAVLILIGVWGTNAWRGGGLSMLSTSQGASSENALFDIIYDSVQASNTEDLELYMSCIHPESDGYSQTEQIMEDAFATYDLSVEVSDLQVIEQTSSAVQVAFTMVTHKLRGPDFRDYRIQGIFLLRPDQGVWKIYDQKVENTEYLD